MKPLNKYFDHTLLKPEATPAQIQILCREAKDYDFYSVCVNSSYVKLASSELSESDVKIASVIGFPLGTCTSKTKTFEAEGALKDGSHEIDMVMNIGMFKFGNYDYVKKDIHSVVNAAAKFNGTVKVILETCLLSDDEIVKACLISKEAGAQFVKTSTGFNSGGATSHHIKLMKDTIGNSMKIKASGGIRSYDTVMEMINAGADRIGASASVEIMKSSPV